MKEHDTSWGIDPVPERLRVLGGLDLGLQAGEPRGQRGPSQARGDLAPEDAESGFERLDVLRLPRGDETLEIGDHGAHLRLLQHDLAEPDAVRCPRMLPRQVLAAVPVEPREEIAREVVA